MPPPWALGGDVQRYQYSCFGGGSTGSEGERGSGTRQAVQVPSCDKPTRMERIKSQVHTLRVN